MRQAARSPPGAWRLFAPALVAWGITAIAVGFPGAGRLMAWLALIAAIGIVASWVRSARRGSATGAPLLLGLAAVGCALLLLLGVRIESQERARAAPELVTAAETQREARFPVTLTGFPQKSARMAGSAWVAAEVRPPSGRVPVLLWLSEAAPEHSGPGTRLTVQAVPERLDPGSSAAYGMSVRSVEEGHAADRVADERDAREDSTSTSTTAKAEQRETEEKHAAEAGQASGRTHATATFQEQLGRTAALLRETLRAATAETPGAELVAGFAVGDTSQVPETLDAQMRDSSLLHLTAVSGANCALVIGAVVALTGRCGAGRRVRTVLAGIALGGFVTVVGPDPSVQRAAVMATVMLVSRFGGRRARSLPALGAAIIVLLLADPWQSRQPGFALSVAATAGILLLVPALGRLVRRATALPEALALPVSIAVAAQIACGPLLLLLQEGLPASGILANVIAAPAAPLGTGLGMLAMLTLPLRPELGQLFVVLASWATRWVAATAEVTAGLPFARWHWPDGWVGALLLAGCQVALLLAWALATRRITLPHTIRAETPWSPVPELPRLTRTLVSVLLCGAVAIFVSATALVPLAERATTPARWNVVACDVGQGDALLLRDPREPERSMLVDTGDDPEKLVACLDAFGVGRISLLVLSHDDRDHVGALDAVSGRVDTALIAPPTIEQREHRPLLRDLQQAGIPTTVGEIGQTGALQEAPTEANAPNGVTWTVLGPREHPAPAESNAASLVMRVQAGELSVLLLGDTGEEEQLPLLAHPEALVSQVVKVAHHGSGDHDPRLFAVSGASLGLISVGEENGYGHPHPDALRGLAQAGIETLRTDTHGSIAISVDDGAPVVWVEHGAADTRETAEHEGSRLERWQYHAAPARRRRSSS